MFTHPMNPSALPAVFPLYFLASQLRLVDGYIHLTKPLAKLEAPWRFTHDYTRCIAYTSRVHSLNSSRIVTLCQFSDIFRCGHILNTLFL